MREGIEPPISPLRRDALPLGYRISWIIPSLLCYTTHVFRYNKLSKGLMFTLLASLIGAFWIVISRYLLMHGENPLNLSAWLVSLTVLPWIFLFQKHKQEFGKLSQKNIILLIFIGVASSLGINYLQALALENSTAINFSLLYRTIIIFTVFFAWIFFKEALTLKKVILVAIILFGSFLLTANGQSIQFTQGDIYTIMFAASGALISNIFIKYTVSKMHTDLSGSVTNIIASVCLISLALLSGSFAVPQNIWLVLLGSCCYFVHILFRNRSYRYASASFVTMVFAMTPLYVSVLAITFLGETMSLNEMFGGLLIVGSVFFVERLKV